MPPIDPRRDSSDEHHAVLDTASDMNRILVELRRMHEGIDEVRAGTKSLAVQVSELTTAHGTHRGSLERLTDELHLVKTEVAKVRVIAERADEAAVGAHRKISDTQHGLTMTLEGVQAGQNGLASKTAAVAAETFAQTTMLAAQAQQLTLATTLLERAKRNLPALLALATIAGTILGKLLEAVLAVIHH